LIRGWVFAFVFAPLVSWASYLYLVEGVLVAAGTETSWVKVVVEMATVLASSASFEVSRVTWWLLWLMVVVLHHLALAPVRALEQCLLLEMGQVIPVGLVYQVFYHFFLVDPHRSLYWFFSS